MKWLLKDIFLDISRHRDTTKRCMCSPLIGVFILTIILMVSESTIQGVLNRFARIGTNVIMVFPGTRLTSGGIRMDFGELKNLTDKDLYLIQRNIREIEGVAPGILLPKIGIQFEKENYKTVLLGTSANFPSVLYRELALGSFFNQRDIESHAKVCILGWQVYKELFSNDNPLGEYIEIKGIFLRVIGVLSERGEVSSGRSEDTHVMIPYTLAQDFKKTSGLRYDLYDLFFVRVKDNADIALVKNDIAKILRRSHRLLEKEEDDFSLRSWDEFLKSATASRRALMFLTSFIAFCVLLIGIYKIKDNIEISVILRKREIGIRRVQGASKGDILKLFLGETVLFCLFGCALGLIFALVPIFIMDILNITFVIPYLGMVNIVIHWELILVPLGLCVLMGTLAGFLSARKAAKLNLVESLRFEY